MPKKKKQKHSKSPAVSESSEDRSKSLTVSESSKDRSNSPDGGNELCPYCGKPFRDCVCDIKHLPPAVGLNRNRRNEPSPSSTTASQVTWDDADRYSLPPVDKSDYDIKDPPSAVSKASSRSRKSRPEHKQKKTTRWTEEFLVNSPRTGCWCSDCPWLIAWGILLVIWVVLVWVCFYQKEFNYRTPSKASNYGGRSGDGLSADCLSVCSRLTPPEALTAPQKAAFHCTLNYSRWVGAPVTVYNNPNCVADCKSFGYVADFLNACALGFVLNGEETVGRAFFDGDTRFFDDKTLDWHWIAHIMVIANTISLFLLLMPLFFCCLQVIAISLTSIILCIALTVLLWYYAYAIIWKQKEDGKIQLANQFFISQTVFAVLATILTIYVITVAAVVVTKRLKVSCEVARFTSKFVNSVPTILLEALLTLILLLIWAVFVLVASMAIEGAEQFISLSGERNRILPLWALWSMRVLTAVVAFWTAQFIINCQTIIIHGAMARFYFDKKSENRVWKSHKRLLKYHLCTACFSGLLFNWLYWLRWFYPKSIIRSKSLFGTATYGVTFVRAGREVNHLLQPPDGFRLRVISKVNPFYFLMHVDGFVFMAIVTHLVFYSWKYTLYIELILVFYAYFVILATVNIYRVTKDAIFLCYELDRSLTTLNPARTMKMTDEDPYIFTRQDSRRVNPR